MRSEVQSTIEAHWPLAAKFVRLGFHDCVGGCDGRVDLDLHDNFGLDVPTAALDPVVAAYANEASGLTRADIWAFAALLGAELSQPSNDDYIPFPMTWVGRQGCEHLNDNCFNENGVPVACDKTHGPHRLLPGPDMTAAELVPTSSTSLGTQLETPSRSWERTPSVLPAVATRASGVRMVGRTTRRSSTMPTTTCSWGGTHRHGHDESSDPAVLFHGPQWLQEFVINNNRPGLRQQVVPHQSQRWRGTVATNSTTRSA